MTDWATIEQYIISITPCLTAIISLIAAIVFAIKKCKGIEQSTIDKINDATADIVEKNQKAISESTEIKTQMKLILKENAELKRMLLEEKARKVKEPNVK